MASVSGPDFIAVLVEDLERAAAFYESALGLVPAPASPPGARVYATVPVPMALRAIAAGAPRPGAARFAPWLRCDDARGLRERIAAAGGRILSEPEPGPFGLAFRFEDPEGNALTAHEGA